MWKKTSNAPIVEGESDALKSILKSLEMCMSGGKVVSGRGGISRQSSFANGEGAELGLGAKLPSLEAQGSFGIGALEINGLAANDEDDDDALKDPREWIKVIGAFEQPRMVYNTTKKHFEK